MKYFIAFLIFIVPASLFAQIEEKLNESGFKNKVIDRIEHSNKRTSFFIQKEFRKRNKNIHLQFRGDNDSVSIYLNDSLLFSQWVYNLDETYNVSRFTLAFESNENKSDIIIISLNNRKEYIKFKIKKKYFSIWIGYDSKQNEWIVAQDNNLPME